MRQVRIAHALSLFALIGIFISGVLAISHYLNKSIPCGVYDGCDRIVGHPASYFFGTPISLIGPHIIEKLLKMREAARRWHLYGMLPQA